jgi:hypothetical protein
LIRHAKRLLALCGALGAVACSTRLSPRHSGGRLLEGTATILPRGSELFAISPDDRFVLFPSTPGPDAEASFDLYELQSERRHATSFDPRAQAAIKDGALPLMRSDCWRASPDRAVLPSLGGTFELSLAPPWVWRLGEPVATPAEPRAPVDPRLDIRRSGSEVALARSGTPGVLAIHRKGPFASSIGISSATVSPDGLLVAYVVEESSGSFASPPRAFLVELDRSGTPVPLAAPVYGPCRFEASGRRLLGVSRGDDDRLGIFVWDVRTALHRSSRPRAGLTPPRSMLFSAALLTGGR